MRPAIQFSYDPPVARLRIGGDLDLSTGDSLVEVLEYVVSRGSTQVELDLVDVTFIDAYALALLRTEQRRLRFRHGDLRVVAASEWYRHVTRLARYDTLEVTTSDAVPSELSWARDGLPGAGRADDVRGPRAAGRAGSADDDGGGHPPGAPGGARV